MKRGPVRQRSSSLRICQVLDALRSAYPRALELRALARTLGVEERYVRRDVETLQLGYAIVVDEGEPFARGGRGPRRIAWAENPRAELKAAAPASVVAGAEQRNAGRAA